MAIAKARRLARALPFHQQIRNGIASGFRRGTACVMIRNERLLRDSSGGNIVAELLITFPDGRNVRHTLAGRPEVIGRDAAADIPIDDPSASRRHARFAPSSHGYVVEDLGSKNGTLVNDVPCTSRPLQDGDVVQVGSTTVEYRMAMPSTTTPIIVDDNLTRSHATHYLSREQRLLIPQQRLQVLYDLGARLTTLQGRQQLLENAMEVCFDTLKFERGAIALRRRNSRALDWPVVRNLRGAEGEITLSRTLLTRALERGERALFTDEGPGSADPTVSMVQQGIRSAMCVPLIKKDQIVGIIYGDRISTSAAYTTEDIDFFAGIAHQVTIGLVNCDLVEDLQEMVRLKYDLDLARKIQTGLFPTHLPNRENVTIAALNEPGQRVSGDYYDVAETPDGRVWCLIADVTGEGIAAALLMANLQAAVRVTIHEAHDPAELLTRWNELIWRNTDASKFVTCLLALIDPLSQQIRLACAGHHPPLVIRPGEAQPVEVPCNADLPLGVSPEVVYGSTVADLGPAPFTFFCYTDGVVEAMNPDQTAFGSGRLLSALREGNDLAPQALIQFVRKRVTAFVAGANQSDDLTLLAVRVG